MIDEDDFVVDIKRVWQTSSNTRWRGCSLIINIGKHHRVIRQSSAQVTEKIDRPLSVDKRNKNEALSRGALAHLQNLDGQCVLIRSARPGGCIKPQLRASEISVASKRGELGWKAKEGQPVFSSMASLTCSRAGVLKAFRKYERDVSTCEDSRPTLEDCGILNEVNGEVHEAVEASVSAITIQGFCSLEEMDDTDGRIGHNRLMAEMKRILEYYKNDKLRLQDIMSGFLYTAPLMCSYTGLCMAKIALDHGANVDYCHVNCYGARTVTPLVRAIYMQRISLVKLLFKYGADVNALSGNPRRGSAINKQSNFVSDIYPLDIAVRTMNNHLIQIILEKAPRVDMNACQGVVALIDAYNSFNQEVVEYVSCCSPPVILPRLDCNKHLAHEIINVQNFKAQYSDTMSFARAFLNEVIHRKYYSSSLIGFQI